MKYNPNEPYGVWVERVRKFEHGYALQRLANGEDPDLVLEQMSKRIMNKLTHPLVTVLTAPKPLKEQILASRAHYEETYVKKVPPRADQMDGQIFDKPE